MFSYIFQCSDDSSDDGYVRIVVAAEDTHQAKTAMVLELGRAQRTDLLAKIKLVDYAEIIAGRIISSNLEGK